MQGQNAALRRWFSGARMVSDRWLSISQVPFLRKSAVEGDILIAGDAAGLIAPLTGDGMSMALRGGQMAALFVNRYLSGELGAVDLPRAYATEWKRAFDRRLWLGRLLQGCIFQPRLLSLGLRILNRTPTLGRYLVDHTRDAVYLAG
jgi:flavin-dependent dehydrogenase